MHFLDLTLSTVAENLALDEALLLDAGDGRGGEILRLWEWPQPAVVLGSGCRLTEDTDRPACVADGVPVARRASGGGTVLLATGCLCYSLVLAYDRDPALREIRSSYVYILGRIRTALTEILPGVVCAGTSDLVLGGLKFSGNSQQRKRHFLLHHGTLLYDFDIGQVGRYLHLPRRQPDYRRGRDHAAFLTNLPVAAAELRRCLRAAWQAWTNCVAWPQELVQRLIAEKYSQSEWIERR